MTADTVTNTRYQLKSLPIEVFRHFARGEIHEGRELDSGYPTLAATTEHDLALRLERYDHYTQLVVFAKLEDAQGSTLAGMGLRINVDPERRKDRLCLEHDAMVEGLTFAISIHEAFSRGEQSFEGLGRQLAFCGDIVDYAVELNRQIDPRPPLWCVVGDHVYIAPDPN